MSSSRSVAWICALCVALAANMPSAALALRCAPPDLTQSLLRHGTVANAAVAVGQFRGLTRGLDGTYRGQFETSDGALVPAAILGLGGKARVAGAPDIDLIIERDIAGSRQDMIFLVTQNEGGEVVFRPGLCPFTMMGAWNRSARRALQACTLSHCRRI